MKRILNLNTIAVKIVTAILVFAFGIPALLYGLSLVLGVLRVQLTFLTYAIWVSVGLGALLLLGFFVLIVLEQIQDELLYRNYQKGRGQRILGENGLGECPYCGFRGVREFERFCPGCGKTLG